MTMITPNTVIDEGEYNEAVNRQVRSIVTANTADLDAWLEIIDSVADDPSELSERAQTFCDGHGIDCPADYSTGDYLEGAVLRACVKVAL